jgi:hypothetical protein
MVVISLAAAAQDLQRARSCTAQAAADGTIANFWPDAKAKRAISRA